MMMSFKNSVIGSCLMLIAFACWFNANSSEAFGTFGLDIHHRYSDTVKEFLNVDGLPEKGTADYYSAMAHRDRHLMSRHLAASTPPPLTFYGNNRTYNLWQLGFLQYSYVRVGTPALRFLVALDTGSDLFWLPCDCPNCARNFNWSDGSRRELNIYSPSNSTTSTPLPCNSTLCGPTRGCSASLNACSYEILNGNTSSTRGILVNDILHLGTNVIPQDIVDVPVTFGCGKNQTGNFLTLRGLNGVFGLGMGSISVPSILANKSVASNSFSVCFVTDGIGRIEFGDKGSPEQKTTPFNLQQSNPTYNITVTQVGVGNNVSNIEFTTIFDSGTATTHLSDPAYSFITNNFNSRVTEKPYHYPFDFVLDYCYVLSANQDSYITPNLIFTMKGGSQFNVTAPTIQFDEDDGTVYCLAIIKSEDNVNIIGQNFMTGYRLVFDREEVVLGWKESDCGSDSISSRSPPKPRPRAPQQPPPPPPTTGGIARLSSMTSGLMAVMILSVLSHLIVLSP